MIKCNHRVQYFVSRVLQPIEQKDTTYPVKGHLGILDEIIIQRQRKNGLGGFCSKTGDFLKIKRVFWVNDALFKIKLEESIVYYFITNYFPQRQNILQQILESE